MIIIFPKVNIYLFNSDIFFSFLYKLMIQTVHFHNDIYPEIVVLIHHSKQKYIVEYGQILYIVSTK